MRRLLLILLIALLPLRGWATDAMALPVSTPETLVSVADNHHMTLGQGVFGTQDALKAAAHAGCHESPALAGADVSPDASAAHAGGTCSACALCHSAWLSPARVPVLPTSPAPAMRPASTAGFASVTPAPGFKPPIA